MAEDDKEDELEAGRMPLLQHLVELRNRLLWAFAAILGAFVICYQFKEAIYRFLAHPLADIYAGEAGRKMIFTGLTEAFFRSWRTSSSSASRIIWSMLPWNSRDRVRALRTQKPATRRARGRSFGPITTSATIPISINSGQPISNSIGRPKSKSHHQTAPQGAGFISERRASSNRRRDRASFETALCASSG